MKTPYAIPLRPADDRLSSHVAAMEAAVDGAPDGTDIIILCYDRRPVDATDHRARRAAFDGFLGPAAIAVAPRTRIVGICPGLAAIGDDALSDALAQAIAFAVDNPAITGQILQVTPD